MFLNKNVCLATFLMASVSFVESSGERKGSCSSEDDSILAGERPGISPEASSEASGSRRSSDDAFSVAEKHFDHNAVWAQAFASQKSHQHVQAAQSFLNLMDFATKNPKYAPLFPKLYEGARSNLDASLQKDHYDPSNNVLLIKGLKGFLEYARIKKDVENVAKVSWNVAVLTTNTEEKMKYYRLAANVYQRLMDSVDAQFPEEVKAVKDMKATGQILVAPAAVLQKKRLGVAPQFYQWTDKKTKAIKRIEDLRNDLQGASDAPALPLQDGEFSTVLPQ